MPEEMLPGVDWSRHEIDGYVGEAFCRIWDSKRSCMILRDRNGDLVEVFKGKNKAVANANAAAIKAMTQ